MSDVRMRLAQFAIGLVTTLWGYLEMMCVAMPLGGAIAPAKLAHKGLGGYAIGILIGLALGGVMALALHSFGSFVARRLRARPVPKESHFRALYFVAVLWAFFGVFAATWLSSLILRTY
jgi:hypothetical protein